MALVTTARVLDRGLETRKEIAMNRSHASRAARKLLNLMQHRASLPLLLLAGLALIPASGQEQRKRQTSDAPRMVARPPVATVEEVRDMQARAAGGGTALVYGKGTRSSDRWVDGPHEAQVAVDVGLTGYGVTAYLSLTWDLVVVDPKTEKTRWARSVGAFWNRLSFVAARDDVLGKDLKLLRLGGPENHARYFTLRGEERWVIREGNALKACRKKPEETPGRPVTAAKTWLGPESGIHEAGARRIQDPEAFTKLWTEHAPGKAAPEVDFTRHMVVALFAGKSGNNNGARLIAAYEKDGALNLRCRWAYYQTMAEVGPDGKWIEPPPIHPFGIFVLPRTDSPVHLWIDRQGMIGGPPLWKKVYTF